MKKTLLILIFIGFTAEAKWSCFSDYDKMNDIHVYGCSTNEISGYKTLRGKPSLYIRTSGHKMSAYINAGEYVGNVEDIEVKFDNDNKDTYLTSSSTNNLSIFISEPAQFIDNMKKHKKVLIKYTPYNENPATVEFDIRDFIKIAKKLDQSILSIQTLEKEAKETEQRIALEKKKEEEEMLIRNNGFTDEELCAKKDGDWKWNMHISKWECK